MISFFRSFFQSKLGLALTFGFLVLIAIAFASSDITGTGAFGGVGSDETVAEIDGESIGSGNFATTVRNALEQVRRNNPQVDMASFVDQGGADTVLDQMIDSFAAAVFGEKAGMAASKRLVDSEIAGIQAFRGPDGRFDEQLYRNALRQQGLSEARIRDDIARALLGEQLLVPATFGASMPSRVVEPYAALILEGREGSIAFVPSSAFAPKTAPSDAALQKFYAANGTRYRLPERRILKFATFLSSDLRSQVKVSDAEIKALYDSRKDEFSATERRGVDQVIVPTEAAAKALVDKIKAGATIRAAASSAGLEVSELDPLTRTQLQSTTSKQVADAVFAARAGTPAAPARSGLGWHLAMVRDVISVPARPLAQVRNLLESELSEEKLRQAVSDYTERLEDAISSGTGLEELADAEGLTIQTSPELLANGQAFNQPGFVPVGEYQAMVPVAFALEDDSSPQLAEVIPGRQFVVFAVDEIKPSAPPPLAQVRARVLRDYALAQGSAKAKPVADSIAKKAKTPDSLNAAIAASGAALPPVERIGTTRSQITQGGARVPPPVALLFSMAEGSTKVLEAPQKGGWYVVHLSKINKGDVSQQPALVAATRAQLSSVIEGEISAQLLNAIKAEVGVQRNASAVKRIGNQLAGRTQEN